MGLFKSEYEFRGFSIPKRMMEPLQAWVAEGRPTGSFLRAVLSNNLKDAIGCGDDENIANLPAFVGWLYNEAPGPCWGSREAVDEWAEQHRKRRVENGTETDRDTGD